MLFLPLEHSLQQFDVLDGQLEDLTFAQLFVGRVRRQQTSQVGKSAAHVLKNKHGFNIRCTLWPLNGRPQGPNPITLFKP